MLALVVESLIDSSKDSPLLLVLLVLLSQFDSMFERLLRVRELVFVVPLALLVVVVLYGATSLV